MALRRSTLPVALIALAAVAPSATAQSPLPEPRTHVDPADPAATTAGEGDAQDGPRLTLLRPDTDLADVRRGYLYVRARCDKRCLVEVTATTKISGKQREIAFSRKTLPGNKMRRIKLRIRSDVRRRISAGARFYFEALPLPPA